MRAELEALMRQIQDNQRKDWRLELNEPIRGWISGPDGSSLENQRIQTWIEDLSDRGLGVKTEQALPLESELHLTFRWHGRSLTMRGHVAWERKVDAPSDHFQFAYGIRLTSDDPEQLETQRDLIQKMVSIISERQRSFESMISRVRRRTNRNNQSIN